MIEQGKKQHMLAMGLRLANATGFEVVGEKGAENYQFLFSQFKKMIENDHQCQLVDNKSKESVLQSLDRTIDFYNAKNVADVQNLLENLKNDANDSFVIIPAYKAGQFLGFDHMHGLLIHKKDGQYVVTKTDKLGIFNSFNEINKYANFYTKIPEKKLSILSQMLFMSKQDYHKDSRVSIARSIDILSEFRGEHLPVRWTGYRSISNCPINELLATFRVALYNCKHRDHIFTHEFKPKIRTSKDFHRHFFQTFIDEKNTKEVNNYNQALWNLFEERKDKACRKNLCQNAITNKQLYVSYQQIEDRGLDSHLALIHKQKADRFVAQHFFKKTLDLPNTPDVIRNSDIIIDKEIIILFNVFTSDSKELKTINTDDLLKPSLSSEKKELKTLISNLSACGGKRTRATKDKQQTMSR